MTDSKELQAVLDKAAIREATMRYCRGVDRFDAAMINSAYHVDAYDDHTGKIFNGPTIGEDIVEWLTPMLRTCTHHITTQYIEVYGDTAGCESYYNGWHVERERDGVERTMHTVGRYVDKFEKRDGQWRIADRLVILETAHYLVPDVIWLDPSIELAGKHDRSDPSYKIFAP